MNITTYPPAHNRYNTTHCGICLDDFKEGDQITALACHHIYNASCALSLQKCPACHTPIQQASGLEVPDNNLISTLVSQYIDQFIIASPTIQSLRSIKNANNWIRANPRGLPNNELEEHATRLFITGLADLKDKYLNSERQTDPKHLKCWKACDFAIASLVFRYSPTYGTFFKRYAEKLHENPALLSNIQPPITKSDLQGITFILQSIQKDLDWMDLQEGSLNQEELAARAKQLASSLVKLLKNDARRNPERYIDFDLEKLDISLDNMLSLVSFLIDIPPHLQTYARAILKEAADLDSLKPLIQRNNQRLYEREINAMVPLSHWRRIDYLRNSPNLERFEKLAKMKENKVAVNEIKWAQRANKTKKTAVITAIFLALGIGCILFDKLISTLDNTLNEYLS